MTRTWEPLLGGALARQATTLLDELTAALRDDDAASGGAALQRGAGRALLWHYLARARPASDYDALRAAALERVERQLASEALPPSLYGGFVGAAWVIDHLSESDDDRDALDDIDEALAQAVTTTPWPLDFDLISGLAGIAIYALGRLHTPAARVCLERVVARLDEQVEERGPGLAWLSRPELRIPDTRKRWPRGYYNYGVAHGVPAIALALAGAVRAGVASDRARRLLDGALRWQWAGRRELDSPSAFDLWEQDRVGHGPARLAWCYGDAGAATTLYAAARAVGDVAGAERALAVARASTTRARDTSGVIDGGLCHGAAGLALLYARLANETGEALFADAARVWFEELLALHARNSLIAAADPEMFPNAPPDRSFLTGTTGVALALLAVTSTIEPQWDRLLAASLPPTP